MQGRGYDGGVWPRAPTTKSPGRRTLSAGHHSAISAGRSTAENRHICYALKPRACLVSTPQQRIVRLGGPVDDDMANLVVAQLLYLDSAGGKDITMYVNSPGGSVTAGAVALYHLSVASQSSLQLGTLAGALLVIRVRGHHNSNSHDNGFVAGMAVFDTMRHIRPDVSTVCVGLAASMGAFLLAGGHAVGIASTRLPFMASRS